MHKDVNKFSWIIGGQAGQGIMSAGEVFAKSIMKGGLNVFTSVEHPSLIRGGHNSYAVRVEEEEVKCSISFYNLLVALNRNAIDYHKDSLKENAGVIYDADTVKLDATEFKKPVKLYPVPFAKMVAETEGAVKIMQNTIAVGASLAVMDFDFRLFEETLTNFMKKKKKDKFLKLNLEMAKKGYDYIKSNYSDDFDVKFFPREWHKRMFLNGNQALALGAIKAGCKFLAAYPMTPASGIMNYFVTHEEKATVHMKQADDEISAINAVLGASYAGVRSMTSTSGGGLALMTETISLVGMSEVPLVIVDVQRPGPATGLPTRQGQTDLKFVLNIGHGDFPRIVLAPGDHSELFYETFNAFNLADKYQLPVLILSDKHLGLSNKSIPQFDTNGLVVDRGELLTDAQAKVEKDYKRFKVTPSGISPRAIPGQKTIFRSSSDEHTEYGDICEDPANRIQQEDKRFRKLETAIKDIPLPKIHGPKDADVTLVSWGSTKGAILEAMKYLNQNHGLKVNFLQMLYIYPFHSDFVKKILDNAKQVICIEENKTGQLAGVIREHTGFEIKDKILKYNGRAFFPGEIYDEVKRLHDGRS